MPKKQEDGKEDPPKAGRAKPQAADDAPGPSTETPAAKRPRGRPPKAVSVDPLAPIPIAATAARKLRKAEDVAQPETESPSTSKAVPTKARRLSPRKRPRSSSSSGTVDTASDAPKRRRAKRRSYLNRVQRRCKGSAPRNPEPRGDTWGRTQREGLALALRPPRRNCVQ
ncbi:hypothetical protein HPB52_020984 [Rhipicephalus sanguineus]|uniref:Uncharacterized protein n=1 Tax=Rhipicephalus sanguineus TaxID=34632 RepID=A0A9D4TBJ8_RHISA|nr:hypothetical protein HPB52_020984 [Rhipicephalus sanguineus]